MYKRQASWDATVPVQKLLSTIVRLDRERGQRFGAGQIINVLRGVSNERSEQSNHQELSVWGIGDDLSESEWRAVVRQLLARNVVETVGEYGTLVLAPASGPLLRGEESIMLRTMPDRRTGRSSNRRGRKANSAAAAELDESQQKLFESLRTWRTAEAKEQQVPAYVVFPDATLIELARERPVSDAALAGISGIGAKKQERYSQAVLAVIAEG